MRITIDRDGCTSCALCWEEYPDLFQENPNDGLAQIAPEYRVRDNPAKGEVMDDELMDAAVAASDECPAEVIQVSEEA